MLTLNTKQFACLIFNVSTWRYNFISKCKKLHHKGCKNLLSFKNALIFIKKTHNISLFMSSAYSLINTMGHSTHFSSTNKQVIEFLILKLVWRWNLWWWFFLFNIVLVLHFVEFVFTLARGTLHINWECWRMKQKLPDSASWWPSY